MNNVVERRRIEVLLDRPLVSVVVKIAASVNITEYTLLPTLGGASVGGRWSDDQVTGAQAKAMLLAVTSDAKCEAFIEKLTPMLDTHGLILFVSAVGVIRGSKFY